MSDSEGTQNREIWLTVVCAMIALLVAGFGYRLIATRNGNLVIPYLIGMAVFVPFDLLIHLLYSSREWNIKRGKLLTFRRFVQSLGIGILIYFIVSYVWTFRGVGWSYQGYFAACVAVFGPGSAVIASSINIARFKRKKPSFPYRR